MEKQLNWESFSQYFQNIFFNLQHLSKLDLYIFINIPLQTRHQLEKQLDWENTQLYSKLGLRYPFKELGLKDKEKNPSKKAKQIDWENFFCSIQLGKQ